MESAKIWHLVARKLAGEATLDELRELEGLLEKDPETASQVEIHTSFFHQDHFANVPDATDKAAWQQQQARMRAAFPQDFDADEIAEPPIATGRRFQMLPLAVVTFSLLLLLAGYWWWVGDKESVSRGSAAETAPNLYSNGKDQRSRHVLPDGTVVWLNNTSQISWSAGFGKTSREITLVGEAFFDVAHNPALPMTVHAGPVNIVVKGTAFNVRSFPGDDKIETALIRGLVELSSITDKERKILLKPNEKIVFHVKGTCKPARTPSVQKTPAPLLYEVTKLQPEPQSMLIPEIAWMENKLVFNSEPLRQLAEKMGRWYNVTISIENEALAKEKFTGVFEKESLEEALSALQLTYSFHFTRKGNTIIIQK